MAKGAFGIKVTLAGLAPTLTALKGLPRAMRRSLERGALDKASQVMAKAARARAPRGTRWASPSGTLARAIGRKVKTYRQSGITAVIIGPRRGKQYWREVKAKKDKVFREIRGKTVRIKNPRPDQMRSPRYGIKYAHHLEFGTPKRSARPFLRPAFHATKAQATLLARYEIARGLHNYAAKARARQGSKVA